MRTVDALITAIRTITRNGANPDGSKSIPDSEIVQYINDAQDRIQNLISATKNIAKIFSSQVILNVVGNQEDYTITDRVLLNKQLEYVEFSYDGLSQNYIRLEKLNYFNRDSYPSNYPYGYIKTGGNIKLCPVPSSTQGTLRITFEQELDDLAPKCGDVFSATDSQIVIINVNNDVVPTTSDYVCITDTLGQRLALNIPVSLFAPNTITGTTISSYLVNGATLASLVGGYLTTGRYSTCVSKAPDTCERYLVHYAATELFHRDSSNDFEKEANFLAQIESDILKSMASQTGELQFTPQLSRYEYW